MSTLVSIGAIAKLLGLSQTRVRELVEAGVLTADRTAGGHRRFDAEATLAAWHDHKGSIGPLPELGPDIERSFPLTGLAEDQVWSQLRGSMSLPERSPAAAIAAYAFTEMVNNAIDHSRGTVAKVRAWSGTGPLVVEIEDDGEGVFAHLANGLDLPDLFASIQELSKGKRTTAPTHHSGEGIFFTSKAVDLFRLAANGLAWTVDNARNEHAVGVSDVTVGTLVRLELDPNTNRDLGQLFREFTDEDLAFTKSRPVVKLFEIGVAFVSRSEAKRLLSGMEQFREVEVDFTGVTSVGQGFVDELVRVWPNMYPGTSVLPTNMNPAVEFMVTRGLGAPPNVS